MKILYVTNWKDIYEQSGGYRNDYLNDLLFYGLVENLGNNVISTTTIDHLYKKNKELIPTNQLWGNGFTSTFLIDINDHFNNTFKLKQKVEDKDFDFIIFGSWNRCREDYNWISKIYPKEKIILIDGADEQTLFDYKSHLTFKRELVKEEKNILPISFAMPTNKFIKELPTKKEKTQDYGKIIPSSNTKYIFKTEEEYYKDYYKSYYGVTMKKAGWDAMRHYEIIANGSIPYFVDLESCPKDTLTTLPKNQIIFLRNKAYNFDESVYWQMLEYIFNYAKQYLTTKALGRYLINIIGNQ